MKNFIENYWIILLLGILNLIASFYTEYKALIILNSFVSGMCLTSFVLGCICTYYEEKYGED